MQQATGLWLVVLWVYGVWVPRYVEVMQCTDEDPLFHSIQGSLTIDAGIVCAVSEIAETWQRRLTGVGGWLRDLHNLGFLWATKTVLLRPV